MARRSSDIEEAELATFEEIRIRDCSIKRTLDVVGEKWTLLVIREAFYGAHRFEQFLANVGCARTLLADRFATLVEHGVLRREPYREPGQRERHEYYLTEKGQALHLAMAVLKEWAITGKPAHRAGRWLSAIATVVRRCTSSFAAHAATTA